MSTRKTRRNPNKAIATAGCLWIAFVALMAIAWVSFIVWAVVSIVQWVTSK